MARFALMSEKEARRIVDARQVALAAIVAGTDTATQRSLFMAESYKDASAAHRRLRPVVSDEERQWHRAYQHALTHAPGDVRRAAAFANQHTRRKSRA